MILQCRRTTWFRLLDILISFEHNGYGYYLRPQSSDKATVLVLPCEGGSQIKEMVVFFADTFKMGLFGLKWMSTLCKLCMKVTYLGRWGRLVLDERGLERCQGSAGRLNRSPGDEDDDDEDFVDGDEMFFSPYKRRVLLLKIYFHLLIFTSMAEDTAESESESEICSTCGRRVTTVIIIGRWWWCWR